MTLYRVVDSLTDETMGVVEASSSACALEEVRRSHAVDIVAGWVVQDLAAEVAFRAGFTITPDLDAHVRRWFESDPAARLHSVALDYIREAKARKTA